MSYDLAVWKAKREPSPPEALLVHRSLAREGARGSRMIGGRSCGKSMAEYRRYEKG